MIRITGVKKSYGRKTVLKNISLTLSPGEQAAVIGRNGSGKSTLMQIMAGIIKPDSGTVEYFGHDIGKERGAVAKYCGYLPQEDPLMEELSVQDNISLWSGKRGRPESDLVEFMQLEDMLRTPVSKLSGGMKRRAAIACAITGWPPILLLDEPTGGLDVYHKRDVRDFMSDYRKRNGILVVITHDEEEIRMSSRCFEMTDGILVEKEI